MPFGLVTCAATLAVGVGVSLAVLALLYSAFVVPLPFANASELVVPMASDADGATRWFLTDSELIRLRNAGGGASLASLERWPASRRAWMELADKSGTRRIAGAFVSPELFNLLGVTVDLGRGFVSSDLEREEPVVVISHDLWQLVREGRSNLPSSGIRISGRQYAVVGVLPERFVAPVPSLRADLQALNRIDVFALQDRAQVAGREGNAMLYSAVVRMQRNGDGPSLEVRVNKSSTGSAASRLSLVPLRQAMLGPTSGAVVLLAVLGLLLFLASVSTVASVVMMRSFETVEQMAILSSLGATGSQLSRVLFVEATIIAGGSALCAVLGFSLGGSGAVRFLQPFPWAPMELSLPVVFLMAAACAAVTSLAAAAVARWVAATLLGEAARVGLVVRGSAGRVRGPRYWLAGAQLGFTTSVAVPALGLWLGMSQFTWDNSHLQADDIVVGDMWIPGRVAATGAAVSEVADRLQAKARALPGVVEVATGSELPLLGADAPAAMAVLPRGARGGKQLRTYSYHVDPSFFDLFNLKVLRGRVFDGRDQVTGRPVVVVSARFAMRAFGHLDAVGETVAFHGNREVVGVVNDENWWPGVIPLPPLMYVPRHQDPTVRLCLFVRVRDPALAGEVQRRLWDLDPDLAMDRVVPLEELAAVAFAAQRAQGSAATILGGAAVVIGVLSVSLLTGYTMRIQRHDMAIRAALGASPFRLCAHVVSRFAIVLAPGCVVGLLASWLAMEWLRSILVPAVLPGAIAVWVMAIGLFLIVLAAIAVRAWRGTGKIVVADLVRQT